MNKLSQRLNADRNRLGYSAVLLATAVLSLLAMVLLLSPAKPAAASCGGTTLVNDEASLSAAMTAFNAAPALCTFTVQQTADISLTADLPAFTNTEASADFVYNGGFNTINANGNSVFSEILSETEMLIQNVTIIGAAPAAITSNRDVDLVSANLFGNETGLVIEGASVSTITNSNIIGSDFYGILTYGNLTVNDSTITQSGVVGIYNQFILNVTNSTIHGNNGEGIYGTDNSVATIKSSTITDNLSRGILVEVNTTLTIQNSILAGNLDGECVFSGAGTYTIQSSLFQNGASCGATDGVDGNSVGQNAALSPLGGLGGDTATRLPLNIVGSVVYASPAIDSGDNTLASGITFDQRGLLYPRIVNTIVDMGSTEGGFDIQCPAFPLPVDTELELGFAIACYNAQTAPGVYGIYVTADIDLLLSTIPIDNPIAGISLVLDGGSFTIDGQDNAGLRLFQINDDSNVTIQDITLTNGNSTGDGGAIINFGDLSLSDVTVSSSSAQDGSGVANHGTLSVELSTFDGNSSNDSFGFGGGIISFDNATATIDTTTFSNNGAAAGAGVFGSFNSRLNVTNSTFNNNGADFAGGGIGVENLAAPAVVANSTFSGNSAGSLGGGIANSVSAMTVNNSTFVGNSATEGGGISAGLTFCFTGDMQVMLADGTTKRMAEVAVGDELVGYDFATGQQVTVTVQATMSREVHEFLRLNDLEVTAEHPFAVGNDEWVKAESLQIGDRVLSNGGWTTITSKEVVEKTAEVYNINVSGTHNFYVSDGTSSYLVHNKLMDITLSDVTLNNTIITNSTGGDCFSSGGVFSGSNNLLDDFAAGACAGLGTAAVTNLNMTLGNNGGPTMTHALTGGSNAINNGSNVLATGPGAVALTFDQRSTGFPRINDTTVDVGAYEYLETPPAGYCPVDANVGYLMTDLIGTGQGSLTKGYRTRKLTIPNSADVDSLYGQLAAQDIGLMKYVRFLPQGYPKVQIHAPTSMAYRTYAVDWWGSDLPADSQWVKGQFFWGAKGNKAPRAFVLWPTYATDEQYANVFVTFDESSENHVAWETGFIPTQTQVISIPEVQANGVTVVVRVAIVDNNKDTRPIWLSVTMGSQSQGNEDTAPNAKDTLNLYEFTFENVAAGVNEVTIRLESPPPGELALQGGDSAALIGAAVSYACGGVPPVARNDAYSFDRYDGSSGNLFLDNGSGADSLGLPAATLTSFGGGSLGGTVTDHAAGATVPFAGGNLTVNADGSWTLVGALLNIDVFTFQYQLTNSAGSSTATVSMDIFEVCLLSGKARQSGEAAMDC